jgi:hypothetical protein
MVSGVAYRWGEPYLFRDKLNRFRFHKRIYVHR